MGLVLVTRGIKKSREDREQHIRTNHVHLRRCYETVNKIFHQRDACQTSYVPIHSKPRGPWKGVLWQVPVITRDETT